jgi:hypothetical protein
MSDIRCDTCNLAFKTKEYYKRHLITSRHVARSTNANIITFSCICGRAYSHHQSLYVHRKKCEQHQTIKPVSITPLPVLPVAVLTERIKSYEKELGELRAQVAFLLDKNMQTSSQNTNCNNTNNIETNNNITININAFGSENTEHIDDKAILACIGRVYKSIPSLLEKIHFDPEHPENHNIKITNKKLPYASVMGNNQKWKTVDRKDVIESMVINGYNMLDEKYAEHKDKFTASKQQNFEGFQSKFEAEDKELMKQIKTEVDMMVLNGGG